MFRGRKIVIGFTVITALLFVIIALPLVLNPQRNNNLSVDISTNVKPLSTAEYQKINNQLTTILIDQDPRIALSTLSTIAKNNNQIAAACHPLAHSLGHSAYQKYKDFSKALAYQSEVCNSGYLHGVIESLFKSSTDLTSSMRTVCQNYQSTNFQTWECYHGVGHGLMYFNNNDLPTSLKLCSNYQSTFSSQACANGVFMENFNTDQKIHPSSYLKSNDPFYPCPVENEAYKADCYLYAPIYFLHLYQGKYQEALTWCLTAEEKYRYACSSGVGAETMKQNINNPLFVEKVCLTTQSSEIKSCISGMIGLLINNYGSLTEARDLCDKLQPQNKSTCSGVVENSRDLFEKG